MQNQVRFHLLFNLLKYLPKKYAVRHKGLVQPFFVIGSGRNGSTMLNLMLNQHTALHLPSEQYFLGPSILKFHYYNYALWRDLVKVIVGEIIPESGSHTWRVDSLPDLRKLFVLGKEKKNLQYLLDVIYRHEQSGQIWGDTTPLNAYYLKEIFHTFPDATYFFLIRDGRDVIGSYKKGGVEILGELSDPKNAAKHWLHAIQKYDWLKKRTNVHVVKYEDLVNRPEEVLKGITDKLGLEYEQKMLAFNENVPDRDMYELPVHQNLKKKIFSSSIGSSRDVLSREEVDELMPVLENELKRFSYL